MPGLDDTIEALTGYRPSNKPFPVVNKSTTSGRQLPMFTNAVVDSRVAVRGSIFFAMVGERVDGHDFVSHAFTNGALAACIQRDLDKGWPVLDLRAKIQQADLDDFPFNQPFLIRVDDTIKALQLLARFWRRKFNLRVVGITGSVGKSTSKELIADVLSRRYHTLRSPGNMNNEIGLPLTLLQLSPQHERAVLEMGFYVPGEISFLCDLALPQVGVVTNVGTIHAERAGSREVIARGKGELVEALPDGPEGIAILNYDDPLVRQMAEKTKAKVFYYGLDPHADLWADDVVGMGLDGIRFRLHYRNETLHMRAPMIGRHSVHNILRATAVGLLDGLSWQEIVEGLRSPTSQIRLVVVHSWQGALILDDTYNASPESSLAALNLLKELTGNKIAVLGDMLELGPYERRGHALVGLRAAEVVDTLITVGERGKQIAMSAKMGGLPDAMIYSFPDSSEVIEFLSSRLKRDDVVLVKGSHAMQMDRIVSALEDTSLEGE